MAKHRPPSVVTRLVAGIQRFSCAMGVHSLGGDDPSVLLFPNKSTGFQDLKDNDIRASICGISFHTLTEVPYEHSYLVR